MALTISGTSNGKLGNLSLSANTGDILDTKNTTFFGYDQWRLTVSITSTASGQENVITSNLERTSNASAGYIGTGMTESSGIFTFPATGLWLIMGFFSTNVKRADNIAGCIDVTTDNSSYSQVAFGNCCGDDSDLGTSTCSIFYMFDVTDTSTHKCRFVGRSMNTGTQISGNPSGSNHTCFLFQRVGDT